MQGTVKGFTEKHFLFCLFGRIPYDSTEHASISDP